MIGIYRFNVDFGRQGEISGIFVEHNYNIAKSIGHEVYFGEILGKHSDIAVILEDKMFTLVTDDPDAVNIFQQYDFSNGIDPFVYIDVDELKEIEDKNNNKIEAHDL